MSAGRSAAASGADLRYRPQLDNIKARIEIGRRALTKELDARNVHGFFARKMAVQNLRDSDKNQRFYGFHKVAQIDLEGIRDEVDKFETLLQFSRGDSVQLFNAMATRWRPHGALPSAVVRLGLNGDFERIVIGDHIELHYQLGFTSYSAAQTQECEAFHLAIMRLLRRIIQTEVGQRLLIDLNGHLHRLDEVNKILLGEDAKGWKCRAYNAVGAARLGRPTIDSVPQNANQRQGAQRGSGAGSKADAMAYPNETRFFGTSKDDKDGATIPAHVCLYQEMTHMLHAAEGTQDHTFLSEMPSRTTAGTYAHRGFWYTQEEKNTIAAERVYSEQCGFWLKRQNYGLLAVRIDA